MYLAIGSYERFILGFDAQLPRSQEDQPQKLARTFTYAAHKNAVKCVDAAGKYLVSGGADDTIHLYDVKAEKDLGFLMNPCTGSVPCVELFTPPGALQPSHMLTGSADGAVCVWQAGGDWQHLKVMRGHKSCVNSLSVHPSGKLALSVARDSHMRLWNLVKGRCQYTSSLAQEADLVRFSPSGDSFTLVCGNQVTCHNTSGEGGVTAVLSHDRRVLCVLQQAEQVLLTAAEGGSLRLWDLRTSAPQQQLERAHGTRIRGLVAASSNSTGGVPDLLATASSDGVVKLWDARRLVSQGSCCTLAQADTRARITCMTAADPSASTPCRPAVTVVQGGAGSRPDSNDAASAAKKGAAAAAAAAAAPASAGQASKQKQKQTQKPKEQQEDARSVAKPKQLQLQAKQQQQQQQGKQQQVNKEKHHQSKKQGTGKKRAGSGAVAGGDDFEVVPAGFDGRAGKKQRRQQAGASSDDDEDDHAPGGAQQQEQQQQQLGRIHKPRRQHRMQQQHEQEDSGNAQERLVPHVSAQSTLQMKRKKKRSKAANGNQQAEIISVNRKAPRPMTDASPRL